MAIDLYSKNLTTEEISEINKLAGPILIFGASGFIGTNLFLTLSQCRDDIFGCSRNAKNGWRCARDKQRSLIDVDLTEYKKLSDLILEIEPGTVFNLSSYGGHSHQTDIDKIHRVNYTGTLNLIRALSDIDCDAFIQAGSSSEYGLNDTAPNENSTLEPNSDYAVSKIGASYLVRYYGKVTGFPAMHLRLYSIYGPWQERQTLMPILISKCLENKWPNLVDRNISHDFVYVDDCVNAFIKAALNLHNKENFGESINIATGIGTTTEDLANTMKRILNIASEPTFGSMANRKWDIPKWYGNPELANKILNWHSRTSLEEGIRLLIDWEKEFKKTA